MNRVIIILQGAVYKLELQRHEYVMLEHIHNGFYKQEEQSLEEIERFIEFFGIEAAPKSKRFECQQEVVFQF